VTDCSAPERAVVATVASTACGVGHGVKVLVLRFVLSIIITIANIVNPGNML
jgi:hypothetical protein